MYSPCALEQLNKSVCTWLNADSTLPNPEQVTNKQKVEKPQGGV